MKALLAAGLLMSVPSLANTEMLHPNPPVPLEQATDIGAQPLALLSKFPDAGPGLARYVAQVISKQPSVVDAILSIVKDSSPEQASAIGAGLVRSIRAMGGKQPAVVRSISEKVSRTDNRWLKTTFSAIGPTYRSTGAGERASLVPKTRPPLGEELVGERGRIGPTHESEFIGTMEEESHTLALDLLGRPGMIVAMLASDAPGNGAVSTSPTN